jgi:amino acid efflux transporter
MNAYFAGGSRLGAALARDGALPVGLAAGSGPGEVPRRSLALLTALSFLALLVAGLLDLELAPLMLLATGCFTLVYVLGTAAAVRLLPRRTSAWWMAVVALASVLGLLGVTGVHVLWALGLASGSAAYQAVRSRRLAPARPPLPKACPGVGT